MSRNSESSAEKKSNAQTIQYLQPLPIMTYLPPFRTGLPPHTLLFLINLIKINPQAAVNMLESEYMFNALYYSQIATAPVLHFVNSSAALSSTTSAQAQAMMPTPSERSQEVTPPDSIFTAQSVTPDADELVMPPLEDPSPRSTATVKRKVAPDTEAEEPKVKKQAIEHSSDRTSDRLPSRPFDHSSDRSSDSESSTLAKSKPVTQTSTAFSSSKDTRKTPRKPRFFDFKLVNERRRMAATFTPITEDSTTKLNPSG